MVALLNSRKILLQMLKVQLREKFGNFDGNLRKRRYYYGERMVAILR